MKSLLPTRKKKAIFSAIAAGMCVSGLLMPQNAEAMEQFYIDWDGKTIFDVTYYGASDYSKKRAGFYEDGEIREGKVVSALNYDLTSGIKTRLNEGFKWWAEILGPGANMSQAAKYFVGTNSRANATATSISIRNERLTNNPNLFTKVIQNGQTVLQLNDIEDAPVDYTTYKASSKDDIAFGLVTIGQYLGRDSLNDGGYGFVKPTYYANATPETMIGIDVAAIMFHEIGHSLGINFARNVKDFTMPGMNHYFALFSDFDEKILRLICMTNMEDKQNRMR